MLASCKMMASVGGQPIYAVGWNTKLLLDIVAYTNRHRKKYTPWVS